MERRVLYAVLVVFVAVYVQADSPVVTTPMGPIKGVKDQCEQTGETVYRFRGIRYAKAPVGDLRFRKSVPVDKWTDTLDATSYGAGCPQKIPMGFDDFAPKVMSEDCLFLNVYVPKTLDSNRKIPVMVWIHGGGLMIGFSHQYDGAWLATSGDVIVVTLNYRLDALGFLALDHPASLGNYGLWDQKLALQWVQANIASFGGDPNTVTIFGESGGGWSVSLLSLIPSNKGLFHRVIAQSGVTSDQSLTPKNSKITNERLIKFAGNTQCPVNDMYKFVDCLRQKDYDDVLVNFFDTEKMPKDKFDLLFLPHSPVVDGELYKNNPLTELNDVSSDTSKFFRSLDFMTGYTSNEMAQAAMGFPPQTQEYFKFNGSESIPFEFMCEGMVKPYVERLHNNDLALKEKLCNSYKVDDSASVDEQSMRVLSFMNDLVFVAPTLKMLEIHSSNGPSGKTFQYIFAKESEMGLMGPLPKYVKGCGHGDELQFMFEMGVLLPALNKTSSMFNEDEKKLSNNLIKYFTSFAKTGVPTAGEGSLTWKEFDLKERNYLKFDWEMSSEQNANPDTVELWLRDMPKSDSTFKFSTRHDEL